MSRTKAGIRKNYFFNLAYQIFSLITPLITAPYVSRVLGSSGVGQYGFTFSIASYFVLIGSLGFNYYAQREIARLQENRKDQSVLFWEIFYDRLISISAVTVIYCILIYCGVFGSYATLMWILSIHIVSTIFDITFLFQGNDDFIIIAVRNIIIRCIGIASIFIFVRDKDDVWVFILCQCIITVIANLSLWVNLRKDIDFIQFKDLNLRKHVAPVLKLFIPSLAMSIYTMLDRTLIGVLIPGEMEVVYNDGSSVLAKIADVENGYYEQSEKIVKMAMTLFTALSTVMISRNSNEVAKGNIEGFKQNIYSTIQFVLFLGMPIMFGLSAIASNFTPWFFGPGYDKVPQLIAIFSPIIIIIGLSNILGRQYLIPLQKDNLFTWAICVGAVSNLALNLFLIPLLYSYGAAIASVIAETCVTATMFIFARTNISFIEVVKKAIKYLLAGIIMFVILYFTQIHLKASIINTFLLIAEGGLCYVLALVFLKDEFFLTESKMIIKRFLK